MATANPAMNAAVYQRAGYAESSANVMTLPGTVFKTSILVAILVLTAGFTWTQFEKGELPLVYGLLIGGLIGGCITAFVTIFYPRAAPITAPIYAALEGLFLGAVSVAANVKYPGIAGQAAGLTVGVLIMMLFLYGTGIIRATEKFKMGVFAATGAICLVYMASMILSLFHVSMPFLNDASPIGIGISVVIVIVAALNLILDFDFIEQGVSRQAPKFMEWYGGFSLLVTLIWLYLEILRLLMKLNDRRG